MIIACELCVMEFLLLVQKLLLKTVSLWQSCLFLKCVCDVLNAARGFARDVRCFIFCVLGSVCNVLRRCKAAGQRRMGRGQGAEVRTSV